MAGSVGKPVGVKRFLGGTRVTLKPEAGRQVCPICELVTYRARTLDEPGQWFRFDDTALYLEHRCQGMLRSTPPAGMVATRRVVTELSPPRLPDALGPIPAPASWRAAALASRSLGEPPLSTVDTDARPAGAASAPVAGEAGDGSIVESTPLWRSGAAIAQPAAASVPTSLDVGTTAIASTLQARIDAAAPGDTIDIEPGTYEQALTLRHLLTLRASGDGVVIGPADGPAIALLGCGVTLENVTLRPATGDGVVVRPGEQPEPVSRPIVTLTGCRIEAPNRAIFAMIPAVTVRLFGSTIASDTGSGLMLQSDSAVRAEQTTISTRCGRGVMASDRAILQISGTAIERCGGDGIRVGPGSIVWMDREEPVEIRGNAGHGLAMGPRSVATLRGTVLTANAGWGIQAPGGQLTVTATINAINRYGALDPAGNPVLTGAWVTAAPNPSPREDLDPNDSDAGLEIAIAPEPVEPSAIDPVHSDDASEASPADVRLPDPEGAIDPVPDPDDSGIAQPMNRSAVMASTIAPHASRVRADDLLLRLVMIDGIETVRLKDPRFRWLVRQLPSSAALATLLVDALETVVTVPIVPERTFDLLDQMLDYVGWLAGLTLEEELQSIVAPLTRDTMAPAILARLGWEGLAPATLQVASEIANVTRERVRQVQTRLEQVLDEGYVWAPVLDRVLAELVAIAPAHPGRAVDHLHRLGLTMDRFASVEGIIEAQRVLGRRTGLQLVERSGFILLAAGDDGADAILGEFAAIRIATQKRVNNQGIATLGEIREHFAEQGRDVSTEAIAEVIGLGDDFRVVGGDHVVPAGWDTRNPLWNRLAKMLCLAPGLSVEMAAWQLSRDDRRTYPARPETLRAFVETHPELELRDDGIDSTVAIAEASVLSDSERTLVALFREHGPELSFTELVPLAVGPNFTRVTLALRLASSPLIVKLARNRYRLLTAQDRPSDDLVPVDDDLGHDSVGPPAELEANGSDRVAMEAAGEGSSGPLPQPISGSPAEAASAPQVPGEGSSSPVPSKSPHPGTDGPRDVEVVFELGPESDSDPVRITGSGLPRLVMAPGTEISVRLPDAGVMPMHQVVADLFAGRLRWPAETRRQRWSATRLPDLLEAIYHGLPLGPLVVQRQDVAAPEPPVAAEPGLLVGPALRSVGTAMVIVDGQQRIAWLARLFNPHYRIPGQPQLGPVRVAFQPDTARFSLGGPDSAADPFLITEIGPLVRSETSPWRVTGEYIARLGMVRTIDEVTADRLATAITAVAALRDAHLMIQPVSDRLHPDAIAHLYDRLHRS